jgi:hypothetical protein
MRSQQMMKTFAYGASLRIVDCSWTWMNMMAMEDVERAFVTSDLITLVKDALDRSRVLREPNILL